MIITIKTNVGVVGFNISMRETKSSTFIDWLAASLHAHVFHITLNTKNV
jgi:hypothetical protein